MSEAIHPWHNAPVCRCGSPTLTPAAKRDRYDGQPPPSADAEVSAMYCPACGETWVEQDVAVVAWAWWSTGAHEAKLLLEVARG